MIVSVLSTDEEKTLPCSGSTPTNVDVLDAWRMAISQSGMECWCSVQVRAMERVRVRTSWLKEKKGIDRPSVLVVRNALAVQSDVA